MHFHSLSPKTAKYSECFCILPLLKYKRGDKKSAYQSSSEAPRKRSIASFALAGNAECSGRTRPSARDCLPRSLDREQGTLGWDSVRELGPRLGR